MPHTRSVGGDGLSPGDKGTLKNKRPELLNTRSADAQSGSGQFRKGVFSETDSAVRYSLL